MMKRDKFVTYAWFVVAYTIFVIAFGALVRATGSGAGCGSHWPTCNGEVLPTLARMETATEFGHRLTSGLAGIIVIGLTVWAFRRPSNRATKTGAVLSLVFIIIEGLIGAALVRLELVEDNASVLRAVAIALHLVNTLILLAWMGLTAWAASKPQDLKLRLQRRTLVLLGVGLVGMLVLSAMGAVTALGDTLFPSESLAAGLRDDIDPNAHFLIRLRVIHPVLAVIVSVYLVSVVPMLSSRIESQRIGRLSNQLIALIGLQIVVGVVNVVLLAPLWMQVIHLVLADILWLTLIVLTGEFAEAEAAIPQEGQYLQGRAYSGAD